MKPEEKQLGIMNSQEELPPGAQVVDLNAWRDRMAGLLPRSEDSPAQRRVERQRFLNQLTPIDMRFITAQYSLTPPGEDPNQFLISQLIQQRDLKYSDFADERTFLEFARKNNFLIRDSGRMRLDYPLQLLLTQDEHLVHVQVNRNPITGEDILIAYTDQSEFLSE